MPEPRMTTTARCLRRDCPWTAPPGDWDSVDRAAEKHVRAGHPTAVVTEAIR